MKKFFCFLLLLCLCSSIAMSESLDYAAMTDEQLHSIIDSARAELLRRELSLSGEDLLLFQQDGISLYLTGNYEYMSFGDKGNALKLEAIVINESEQEINIGIENVAVNGWEVYGGSILKTGPGKKQKGAFEIRIYEAGIRTYEEIQDFEFIFKVQTSEGFKTLFKTSPITVHLNQ